MFYWPYIVFTWLYSTLLLKNTDAHELVVLLDASTGKIGSALRIRAGLAPTLPIIAVFRGGGRRPLLSPKRETEAAG
jgi:hypothetical protein